MNTAQLRIDAMKRLNDNYDTIQPLAHIIGMDYPKGYHSKQGKYIFEPHRNYFSGFIDNFKEEHKQGLVSLRVVQGKDCLFRLTTKGKEYLEQYFGVEIIGDEWI